MFRVVQPYTSEQISTKNSVTVTSQLKEVFLSWINGTAIYQ